MTERVIVEEFGPKTYGVATCGWCKSKGVGKKANGDLMAHTVPGTGRTPCTGYAYWFAQGRSR